MQLELAAAIVAGILLLIMLMAPERHHARAPVRHMVGMDRAQLRAARRAALAGAAPVKGRAPVARRPLHAGSVKSRSPETTGIAADLLPRAS